MNDIAGAALISAMFSFVMGETALAQDRIRISSEWGDVTAHLGDNPAS